MSGIAIIDNYDSFTFNLVHLIREISGEPVMVMKNDEVNYEALSQLSHIVLSPGPGLPAESGQLMEVIARYCPSKRILGVCLGLQAIAEHFGYSLYKLSRVYHGIRSKIEITNADDPIFKGIEIHPYVGRYHSWVVNPSAINDSLTISAMDADGHIMAMSHKEFPVHGVQFHPESIMTDKGYQMMSNFLNL